MKVEGDLVRRALTALWLGAACSSGGSGPADVTSVVASRGEPTVRGAAEGVGVNPVGAPSGESGARHALVIGIDGYAGPAAPGCPDRAWRDLFGAANDAREMAAVLRARGFVVATLIDGEPGDPSPTRSNIMRAIRQLGARARRGDVVTFYFAGHGSQIRAPDGLQGAEATEQLWETIVPKDSATACASDITDKELRLELNKILDEIGAPDGALTVILDSCHSGSGVRGPGAVRSVGRAPGRAVSPGDFGPTLESRNTVVLTATSKDQLAQETVDDQGLPRGAFTLALVRALRDAPADETAERVYRRVSARMATRSQIPSISPPDTKRVLFGKAMAPRTTVVIAKTLRSGRIGVDAGRAIGLMPGSVLTKKGDAARTEVRVGEASLACAEIEGPGAASIAPGDELEIVSWASDLTFRVHVPMAPPGRDALVALGPELADIRAAGVTLVDDPIASERTHLVWFERGRWWLIGPVATRPAVDLGERFDGGAIARRVKEDGASRAALHVSLPPPAELVKVLAIPRDDPGRVIATVDGLAGVEYALAARLVEGRLEVAWVVADHAPRAAPDEARATAFLGAAVGSAGPASARTSAPPRTRWVPAEPGRAGEVLDLVERLRFVHSWLTLSSPADGGFVYTLGLRPHVPSARAADALAEPGGPTPCPQIPAHDGRWSLPGAVDVGSCWQIGLVPRAGAPRGAPRFVYVFVIAEDASGCWLFPHVGGSERFPRQGEDLSSVVLSTGVGSEYIDIRAPCGNDTYVMLTSDVAIPLYEAFEMIGAHDGCWPGVVASRARGPGGDGLATLLEDVILGERSAAASVKTGAWGIERVVVTSRGCAAR